MARFLAAALAAALTTHAVAQDVQPAVAAAPAPAPMPAAAPAPAPLPAPPAPLAAAPSRTRDTWYVGFGIGSGGGGTLKIGSERYAFRDLVGRSPTYASLNFRIGATVSPRLLVGLDVGALSAQASSPSEVFQLNYYDVGAMFFPTGRGVFVRAAAGPSALVVETDGPVVAGKGTYSGWNALAGAGYALWLGKAFNLTLNVDYQVHTFDSSGPLDVNGGRGLSAWVGFDWY